MPEVAGNAALLVNPFNVDEIAEAMFRLWSEADLRSELIQKGNIRASYFTWDQSADLLWKSIERALE
jgi:glycosyltransferase involved in cell wall biosynthesis